MLHAPGKLLATADRLSQIPCKTSGAPGGLDFLELFPTETVKRFFGVVPVPLEDLKMAQASDGECSTLIPLCQRSWMSKAKLPLHVNKHAPVLE